MRCSLNLFLFFPLFVFAIDNGQGPTIIQAPSLRNVPIEFLRPSQNAPQIILCASASAISYITSLSFVGAGGMIAYSSSGSQSSGFQIVSGGLIAAGALGCVATTYIIIKTRMQNRRFRQVEPHHEGA